MKWYKAILVCACYVATLAAVYFVHVRYALVDVVFYAALEDAAIALALVAAALFAVRWFALFSAFEKTQLVVICALVGYALAISVPTVLDRSLSFYMLEKLQQRGGGIRYSAFETIFTQEYAKEHQLVDLRLTEQLKSGTVRIDDGCVQLTPKGEALATFSSWFRRNLLPRQRLIMGQYSDKLTAPFPVGAAGSDALCHH